MLELMTASKQPEGHIGLDGTISLVGAITGTLTVNTLSECSAIYGNEAFCSISGNSNGTAVRTALRLNLDTLVTSNAFFDQSNVGTGRRAVQVIWNGSWLISYGGNANINFTKVARNGGNLNLSSALGWARAGAAYSANNFTGYMFGGVNSTLCGRISSPQTGQTTAASITPSIVLHCRGLRACFCTGDEQRGGIHQECRDGRFREIRYGKRNLGSTGGRAGGHPQ